MEDTQIIHLYLERQAGRCFKLLYDRYSTKIFSKCIAMLKDEALAEDATQEIFTKIFSNLSRFGEKSKFSTWIYSITYNFCIDFIRRRKRQNSMFSDDLENAPEIEDEVPDHELMATEVSQLKTILSEIPPGDKYILLMKYQEGLSIKEISEVLDKSESAVKMKIKRAKAKAQRLKTQLFSEN